MPSKDFLERPVLPVEKPAAQEKPWTAPRTWATSAINNSDQTARNGNDCTIHNWRRKTTVSFAVPWFCLRYREPL